MNKPFSAVLLAGGESRRMGQDKAGLEFEGVPLWKRQLATLRATSPAELFISGRMDGPYANTGIETVPDEQSGLGPIGGIVAALRRMKTNHLLVLAIDLPAITPEFLLGLLAVSWAHRGVVPILDDRFEPLAAVYPRRSLAHAEDCLHGPNRSLRHFATHAVSADLVMGWVIDAEKRFLFRNLNSPGDIK